MEHPDDPDGHVLGAITAVLLAASTSKFDINIASLFGAGKSKTAAMLLVGMLLVNPEVKILVMCKGNSAARPLAQLLGSLRVQRTKLAGSVTLIT